MKNKNMMYLCNYFAIIGSTARMKIRGAGGSNCFSARLKILRAPLAHASSFGEEHSPTGYPPDRQKTGQLSVGSGRRTSKGSFFFLLRENFPQFLENAKKTARRKESQRGGEAFTRSSR
jgi:hypothetical protein